MEKHPWQPTPSVAVQKSALELEEGGTGTVSKPNLRTETLLKQKGIGNLVAKLEWKKN